MTAGQLVGLVVIGLLVAGAVVIWPARQASGVALLGLSSGAGRPHGMATGRGGERLAGGASGAGGRDGDHPAPLTLASLWHEDPVLLYRAWRVRHDPDALLGGVLDLLDAMAPALALGLTPATALSLALAAAAPAGPTTQAPPTEPTRPPVSRGAAVGVGRRGGTELERLAGSLAAAASRGDGLADVWAEWARLTGSAEVAFVASAWSLSEHHGAPLAVAVDRAAAGLREARSRRRRVGVAVAGPRATVTVLTVLPLTGPAFAVACGIDPATLYLGSPIGTAGAVAGLVLLAVGRLWCTRMIRRAVAS